MKFMPANQLYKEIGERLRLAREALGLSQVEVAKRVKVSPQRWQNYEKGSRKPDLVTFIAFSEFYGVSLDYLYRDDWTKLPFEIAKYIEDRVRSNSDS